MLHSLRLETTRTTAAVLVAAMTAGLVGCSPQTESAESDSTETEPDTSVSAVPPDTQTTEPEPDGGDSDTDTSRTDEEFIEHVPAGPVKQDPVLSPQGKTSQSSGDSTTDPPRIHPFVETSTDPQSTFAVDVDTGSYTVARKRIRAGALPEEKLVRVEEFVNYFDYDYAEPEKGPFGVSIDGAPSPFEGDLKGEGERRLLRVGLQGKRLDSTSRKPLHLVFLVDVSGSMDAPDKLPLARESLKILARNLQKGDTVAIATYAGGSEKLLEPTPATDESAIVDAVDRLDAGGSTAMSSGLQLAYDLASQSLEKDAVNRVVVVSDGNANVGSTSHEAILDKIQGQVDQGVTLSTVGFGVGYNDELMEQLANRGNGNYFYVDTEEEARRIFGEELESTMQVIAKDVKIQVEFDDTAVRKYRLVGYENRDVRDEEFRDDSVDAGEIGAGHSVTAYYELLVRSDGPKQLGTVRVRHKQPHAGPSDPATEQQFHITRADLRESFDATSGSFQFGTAVTAFAEKLRGSPYLGGVTWTWIRTRADAAVGQDRRRRDFVKLVRRLEER